MSLKKKAGPPQTGAREKIGLLQPRRNQKIKKQFGKARTGRDGGGGGVGKRMVRGWGDCLATG